ncbi:hypothetical protein [Apilactobacillus timberlakei]|uniref:hypothetical protein n=1 Tax=Apilactobacillus timberlakei TaxID=2008380 RepID=UPI0015E86D45|nr:hypothetical protein [Apilactobacillus timberlakei]
MLHIFFILSMIVFIIAGLMLQIEMLFMSKKGQEYLSNKNNFKTALKAIAFFWFLSALT